MDNMEFFESENYELLRLLDKAAAMARPGGGRRHGPRDFEAVPLRQPERRGREGCGEERRAYPGEGWERGGEDFDGEHRGCRGEGRHSRHGREGCPGGFPGAEDGDFRGRCHEGPGGEFPGRGFGEPPAPPHRERERVLTLLSESEGISQRKLAMILDIRPQSLSELLGKLERDGLVERRKNEEDKREILVSLTEQGRERAVEYERSREDAAERFLAPLSAGERATLSALLQKLLFRGEEPQKI